MGGGEIKNAQERGPLAKSREKKIEQHRDNEERKVGRDSQR